MGVVWGRRTTEFSVPSNNGIATKDKKPARICIQDYPGLLHPFVILKVALPHPTPSPRLFFAIQYQFISEKQWQANLNTKFAVQSPSIQKNQYPLHPKYALYNYSATENQLRVLQKQSSAAAIKLKM